MNRHVHYLRPSKRSETIHECVFYDCETEPVTRSDGTIEHHLVFGWAAYRRRSQRGEWETPQWIRFTKGEEFWKWVANLTRNKKTLYVWSHNQSFDYVASCGGSCLKLGGWTLLNAIVDSPPFIVNYRRGTQRLVLTDTVNIWRMSLSRMGTLTGLEKLSMPSSWTGSSSDDDYCKRDVEIIMYAVCQWADFLHENDMGKFCLTVASQAMQTFRHRYLRDQILIDSDRAALEISRAAYHGGRVECFRIGRITGPLYLLDINSLYPTVMFHERFPLRVKQTYGEISLARVSDLCQNHCVCVHATVRMIEPAFAKRVQGKLIFPIGSFDTYLTTPEVQYALQSNQLDRVHECAVYEQGMPFVQFVHDLYGQRVRRKLSGDEVTAEHYKLLLNSFYGKWGQNSIKWEDVGPAATENIAFFRSIDAQTLAVSNYRQFLGRLQRKRIPCRCERPFGLAGMTCGRCGGFVLIEASNSHPAIAAHITAHGRMVLWALMRKVTPEHYFYCDTDSLLVDREGFKRVEQAIDEVVLGGLKVVGEYREAVLYGCKDYLLDGKRTCKGVRNDATETKQGTFEQLRWRSFRGALRAGSFAFPTSVMGSKTLRRVYDKGIIGRDGVVTPFHL